ncbi:hypothetical protein RHS04_02759 [Rhizoctonia solani]|uniref:C2H2-type domain-containing protein n=1 Tax=Rhizoctonia solani TaxID=456999 RepID=A0A8H7HEN6_9AGAM|nr:hypothetical protein RHS04_02759 [Rhizoctonia solani]
MDGWDGTRARGCVSSDEEELDSPLSGPLFTGGGSSLGSIARHADSFVRSTRTRHRPARTDDHPDLHSSLSSPLVTIDIDDVAADDDQGSPRSRRLTFEFRNFNLFPDVSDGRPSSGLLEKHRPSRSLDIQRVDEEPECAGYLTSPGYSTLGPPSGAYFPYGFTHLTQSPPLLPPPPIQRPSEVTLSHSLISTSPIYSHPHPHPYRPIQSTRPGPTSNPRRNSDVGPAPSLTTQHREKRVVTLREPVPVPIRTAPLAPPPPPPPAPVSTQDDDGSSELSELDDADGPSKSGDSSVTSSRTRRKPAHRTRKKKPYKSRRCDICNKTFTKECDVTRHRRTAHGEDEIEFKCHECGRLFNRKDALERHYKVYEGTPHVARRYQPKTYLGSKK